MRIAVLMDAFKGTLSSAELAKMIETHFSACGHVVRSLLVSDGGEGFLDVFKRAHPAGIRRVLSEDPCGGKLEAEYVLNKEVAFIGLHAAAGLSLVKGGRSSPAERSTYGVGLLILDALRAGAERIVLGIGGSATHDGGTGILQALGVRFLRGEEEIHERMTGARLLEVSALDDAEAHIMMEGVELLLAADVRAPLSGPRGAAHMYARQKGAREEDIPLLERAMEHFALLAAAHTGRDLKDVAGAGAAGGAGFGLMSLLGARLVRGIDFFIDHFAIESLIVESDIVIVGEGRLDAQTAQGKAPHGLAELAKKHGKYVIGLFGRMEANPLQGLLDEAHAIVPAYASEEEALARPAHHFARMLADVLHKKGKTPWT